MPGGEQPGEGWSGKDHDFHVHPPASAKARPRRQRTNDKLTRGVMGSTAEFQSPDSLCGLLFNCIVPLKTALLLGACVLGNNLTGVCNAALAAEGVADPPQPHWSHLPVWGVEAEARGYQLPLPLGIGVNYYHEQQPFNINDLQVSRGGPPVSVKDFVQLDQVDTTQWNAILRADVWIFPFLSIYGIGGHTSGKMQGVVGLPAIPILGIPAQDLPLNIGYEGPTYGGGVTLAGGFEVSERGALTLFVVADVNYTVTQLSFTDEKLFTDTNAKALVFSARLGLRRKMSERFHVALWAGTMRQEVSEFLVGEAVDQGFAFLVAQGPVAPWNALIGGRLEIGRHWDLIVEGGVGTRTSIMGGLTFRF